MSLFKRKRIRSKSLMFTRFVSDSEDIICDFCKYQSHCDRNIRGICRKMANHEIVERGYTERIAYIVKSKGEKC